MTSLWYRRRVTSKTQRPGDTAVLSEHFIESRTLLVLPSRFRHTHRRDARHNVCCAWRRRHYSDSSLWWC